VRPFLSLTFLVDRTLYGSSPIGYHVLNLLLHLGSGILVCLILGRAVVDEESYLPLCTALLFLVHPIQTETVTYISGRASGLMGFCYLLAFFLYIKASESPQAGHLRRMYLSGAVAAGLLAIGSKETAVTLPIALLLWDVLIRRLNGPSLREAFFSSHLPFWILLVFAAGWAWSHPRYAYLAQFSFHLRPVWENALSEAHALVYAFLLFLVPWNQTFDHDLPEFHSLVQWPLPFDLVVISAMFAVAVFMLHRLPLATFGIAWFFLQLLPTFLIPRADLLSERNLYLASFGLFISFVVLASQGIVWLIHALKRPRLVQISSASLACVVLFSLGFATVQRNIVYHDQISLWSDTVVKSPNKARPHNNLGHAYALEGEWDKAIDEFRLAVQLDQTYALAQSNLRNAYLHRVGRE
jgi:tetratricopeptide (TPR) repeat protein